MQIQILIPKPTQNPIPFFRNPIPAGPPTPLESQEPDEWIDIAKLMSNGAEDIVFVRAFGLSMKSKEETNIDDGDILAVQRHGFAEPGDIVIAEVNGEFTIKKLSLSARGLYLVPANKDFAARRIEKRDNFSVWGVVRAALHRFCRRAA